jgi:hypothetical protein
VTESVAFQLVQAAVQGGFKKLLQTHVEDEFRGRVLALYSLAQGLSPFGSLAMGFVASEFLGTPHTISAFCVAAMVLALLSGLGSKEIRGL